MQNLVKSIMFKTTGTFDDYMGR